jgi:sulfur-oxidizing protein SoxA
MKKSIFAVATLCVLGASVASANKMATDTSPAEDLKIYRDYFTKRFPGVPLQEYANGVNAVSSVNRQNWEAIEEFPPYEPMIDEGEAIWNKPFANGKTFGSCFNNDPAQRKNYPHWDDAKKSVVTLPQAINACLTKNGEEPMKYKKGKITRLLAYMGFKSRGQKTNVTIPNADALKAYNDGKSFFFARRGQLNFSCAHCHIESAGQRVRTNVLSPALGHTTGWPVYRSKWGDLGTLHRRFTGCNKQVRAKPFKAQGKEYNNLEYFLTYMSNGIEYNGPSARQ